jgi:hypothetical protein
MYRYPNASYIYELINDLSSAQTQTKNDHVNRKAREQFGAVEPTTSLSGMEAWA